MKRVRLGNNLDDLKIYVKAKDFALRVYEITKTFPAEEKYGFSQQLRRASSSIGANIAEGHGRFHYKVVIKFSYIARGSLYECLFFLDLARKLEYISEEEFATIAAEIKDLGIRINNYIGYLRRKHKSIE